MSKLLKDIRLSNKQKLDVATMIHFIPVKNYRIYPNDKKKIAILSGTGKVIGKWTKGCELIKWGKTYRDEQITSYRRDIRQGLFTKDELTESFPKNLRQWLWKKIKDVPYDEKALNHGTSIIS